MLVTQLTLKAQRSPIEITAEDLEGDALATLVVVAPLAQRLAPKLVAKDVV
jgi:hypothetical protein